MKVTAQTIGYTIEYLGSWKESLQPLVDNKTITKEQMEQELKNQEERAKTKRSQTVESRMTKDEKVKFAKQKKKLAKPLHNQADHKFLKEIYFDRVSPDYLREVLHNLEPLT